MCSKDAAALLADSSAQRGGSCCDTSAVLLMLLHCRPAGGSEGASRQKQLRHWRSAVYAVVLCTCRRIDVRGDADAARLMLLRCRPAGGSEGASRQKLLRYQHRAVDAVVLRTSSSSRRAVTRTLPGWGRNEADLLADQSALHGE